MTNIITTKNEATEAAKSDRPDFLALITDVKIPVIVKDIRESIQSDNSLYSIKELTVAEIREKDMDNLIDCSIINFSDTAKYGKVAYKGVEIQIADLLALRSFDLSEIWDEIWDERPISGGWVREAVYTFTDKIDGQSNIA